MSLHRKLLCCIVSSNLLFYLVFYFVLDMNFQWNMHQSSRYIYSLQVRAMVTRNIRHSFVPNEYCYSRFNLFHGYRTSNSISNQMSLSSAVNIVQVHNASGPGYESNLSSEERKIFIRSIANRNFDDVINIYTKYKNSNPPILPRKMATFGSILSVCSKAAHVDKALEVFRDFVKTGLVPSENIFLPLLRCYSDAGDVDTCLDLIRQMKDVGINPKLRCYQPMFDKLFEVIISAV